MCGLLQADCLRLSSCLMALMCWQRGATEEEQAKYSKRSVKVTREQNEDCRRLLRLLGVPIIDVRLSLPVHCLHLESLATGDVCLLS